MNSKIKSIIMSPVREFEGTDTSYRKSNIMWDGIYKRIDELKNGQAFDVELESKEGTIRLRQSIYQRYRYQWRGKSVTPAEMRDVRVFRDGCRLTVARPHIE